MDEGQSLGSVLDPSSDNSRSAFKEKRSNSFDSGGESVELSPKRVKTRDLDSVFRSQGMNTHRSETLGSEVKNQLGFGNTEVTKGRETMVSDVMHTETTGRNTSSHPQDSSCFSSLCVVSDPKSMDLSTKTRLASGAIDNCKVPVTTGADHMPHPVLARDTSLDQYAHCSLNTAGQNSYNPYKLSGYVKSVEASECGSSTGPLEENDSYRKWKEMKRNGFLSSAHGGIPVPEQTQRVKKKKNEQLKKKKSDPVKQKMEIAKREQVHRFTKIAAPSGLLNGLNPGIINHVRNSKQVHSIIEALVRSERRENSIQRSSGQLKGNMDTNEKGKISEKIHDTGASLLEHKGGCGNPEIAERRFCDETSGASHLTSDCDTEMLSLKLSSSTSAASNNCTAPNEQGANHASVSSLSARAATVASQWLELLFQDIRGRLAALRRSKKRVQAVIETELPFLMMKEFPSTKENDPYFMQISSTIYPNSTVSDMHRARWMSLFGQMEKSLTEEGKHLEIWLNQVEEMKLQCERGLQCVNWHSLQSLGRSESVPRSKAETTDRELALRAAAASIYSTCNFVKATEDVHCF